MLQTKLLKAVRTFKGLSQRDMAEVIKKSHQGYQGKENGAIPFTLEEVIMISKALDLTLYDVNNIFFDGKIPIG